MNKHCGVTNIGKLFSVLDKDKKGYLSIFDIESFLIENRKGRQTDVVQDAEFILAKFDKNSDRRVTYLEFVEELTPKKAARL